MTSIWMSPPAITLVQSDIGACCSGGFQQAGLLSEQRKRQLGCAPGQPHPPAPHSAPSPLLLHASSSPASTHPSLAQSTLLARLRTGTCDLGAYKAHFEPERLMCLCGGKPETRKHFFLHCELYAVPRATRGPPSDSDHSPSRLPPQQPARQRQLSAIWPTRATLTRFTARFRIRLFALDFGVCSTLDPLFFSNLIFFTQRRGSFFGLFLISTLCSILRLHRLIDLIRLNGNYLPIHRGKWDQTGHKVRLVAQVTLIRMLLALAAARRHLHVYQADVDKAQPMAHSRRSYTCACWKALTAAATLAKLSDLIACCCTASNKSTASVIITFMRRLED